MGGSTLERDKLLAIKNNIFYNSSIKLKMECVNDSLGGERTYSFFNKIIQDSFDLKIFTEGSLESWSASKHFHVTS